MEALFGGFRHGCELVACVAEVLCGTEKVLQALLVLCVPKSFCGSLFLVSFQ